MCTRCVEWGGKRWHRYGEGYYERTDKSDGKRTLRLHRVVWEDAHGPVPDGHHIHHANHDRGDNRLENLVCLPHSEHSSHHIRDTRPRQRDWNGAPSTVVACCGCGASVERKRPNANTRCRRCHQIQADERRVEKRSCRQCGEPFRSRMGHYCSQRCVNLATKGATVRVLPEGRRRA